MNCFNFKPVDRIPDWEFGAWNDNFPVWQEQGMPEWVKSNVEFDVYFGLETYEAGPPMRIDLMPQFEHKVIKEDDRTRIIQDGSGAIMQASKVGSTIPHFIEFPVKTKDDWEKIKEEKYNLDTPERWDTSEEEWEKISTRIEKSKKPVQVVCGGFYGFVRSLMGVENTSVAFALEPDMIDDIIETRCLMIEKALDNALPHCSPDVATWWEDMCFNHGPLISPEMFIEFMVPRYKRITDKLKEHGITVNILDCDGNIHQLVKPWLEAGINCMFPLEIRGGTDPYRLREEFGNEVLLKGGVDKTMLETKDKIHEELDRITPLVEQGGYIPHVDHRVPPNITLENFKYYLKKKRERFGIPSPE
jgi:uroporphyrinogen decarboxylase